MCVYGLRQPAAAFPLAACCERWRRNDGRGFRESGRGDPTGRQQAGWRKRQQAAAVQGVAAPRKDKPRAARVDWRLRTILRSGKLSEQVFYISILSLFSRWFHLVPERQGKDDQHDPGHN